MNKDNVDDPSTRYVTYREFDDFRDEFRQERTELREQMQDIAGKIHLENSRMGEAVGGLRHQLQVYQVEALKTQLDEKRDRLDSRTNQGWSVRLSVINASLSLLIAILMIIITRSLFV